MIDRYLYKEEDITLDIIMLIEQVVRLIAEKTGREFDECLYEFYKSRVYEVLQNPKSLLWCESAPFIAEEYFKEKKGA